MIPKNRTLPVIVNICSYSLAAILIFSGFTKAVDPVGGALKISEYLRVFGLAVQPDNGMLILVAMAESAVEFVLGIQLLLGIHRYITTIFTVALMALFTLITAYLAITGRMTDCGCFGDAIHLSTTATFVKNIFLLSAAIISLLYYDKIVKLLDKHSWWIAQTYALLFVIGISLFSYQYLPLVDYRPYRIGQNIIKAMSIPADAPAPEYETLITYEKNGTRKTFTLDNLPDSTWTFVNSESKLVKQGYIPEINDFCITSFNGDDVTNELLRNKKFSFWLVFPYIERTDNGVIDAIENLYDYCKYYGYKLYGLTSSDSVNVSKWEHSAGIFFPFYNVDDVVLKTIIRSNPGLLLVKNGVILNKWSKNNLPDEDSLTAPLEKLPVRYGKSLHGISGTLKVLIIFFVPLILLIFANGLYRKRKQKGGSTFEQKSIAKQNTDKDTLKSNIAMRKKIVAGNWKMNKNLQEGIALAKEINDICKNDKPNCGVIICTPFIHLASVAAVLDQNIVALGAENCADKEKGAFTGEVSAEMVKSTGAQYVILGHSERRQYYHETPEILKEKVLLALKNGLKVIFCCGETLEERESGKQNDVVKAELEGSVFNLSANEWKNIVLAYEPIWAIGTGKTATAEQAEEMLAYIRSIVADKYGKQVAEDTTILYGGSCKPSNAPELFSKPDIDGGLIGGASLKAPDFKGIIDAWKK